MNELPTNETELSFRTDVTRTSKRKQKQTNRNGTKEDGSRKPLLLILKDLISVSSQSEKKAIDIDRICFTFHFLIDRMLSRKFHLVSFIGS